MTSEQFTIRHVGGVYVISDGGRIAKLMGLGTDEWHLVAPRAELIGDRIERMSALLKRARELGVPQLVTDASVVGIGVTTSNGNGNGSTNVQLHLPTAGSVADQPIDELIAAPQVRWRLKKAGIASIGALAGFSFEELEKLPGMGHRSATAAQRGMEVLGYRLKQKIG